MNPRSVQYVDECTLHKSMIMSSNDGDFLCEINVELKWKLLSMLILFIEFNFQKASRCKSE